MRIFIVTEAILLGPLGLKKVRPCKISPKQNFAHSTPEPQPGVPSREAFWTAAVLCRFRVGTEGTQKPQRTAAVQNLRAWGRFLGRELPCISPGRRVAVQTNLNHESPQAHSNRPGRTPRPPSVPVQRGHYYYYLLHYCDSDSGGRNMVHMGGGSFWRHLGRPPRLGFKIRRSGPLATGWRVLGGSGVGW